MDNQKTIQKTVCFTGHRTLNGKDNELIQKVFALIQKAVMKGYTHFICGGAVGFDMICAKQVILYKSMFNDGIIPMRPVTLEIAVPCCDQDKKYSNAQKKRYAYILKKADKVSMRPLPYHRYCMKWRNQYMVGESALVIAYYVDGRTGGTKQTLEMAEQAGREIWFV